MKDAILIILGALISCGTTCFLDWLKFNRDEKVYYKRKKEEVYLFVCDLIYRISTSNGEYIKGLNKAELYEIISNLAVKLEIYASSKIHKYFMENIAEELSIENKFKISEEKLKKIIELIRNDLNIKD